MPLNIVIGLFSLPIAAGGLDLSPLSDLLLTFIAFAALLGMLVRGSQRVG